MAAKRPPAQTPEEREHQLVNLAVDLAEKQLAEGTASAQVITHYLKLGSTMGLLERDKLFKETQLMDAKIEAIKSGQRVEELYAKALTAMHAYAGNVVQGELEE